MSVRSRELGDEAERPRGPALFSGAKLARQQSGFERFVAVLLLLVSLAGSVLAGGGGVSRWLELSPIWWGAGAALVVQALLSYVQWIYAATWKRWQYLGAVLVSSALTIIGYWPLAHPWLVSVLQSAQVPALTAQVLGGVLLAVAAMGADVFPEKTLVR